MAAICVFGASTGKIERAYYECAHELGRMIAERGYSLVYGGGKRGLMGTVAGLALRNGGEVVGVTTETFADEDMKGSKVIRTRDLRERKAVMENRSDAFIALPGGFGTLDEIADMIASQQAANEMERGIKPLVILNARGFYASLLGHFERIFGGNFAAEDNRGLYSVASTPAKAVGQIEDYVPPVIGSKVAHAEA
jgi:uncharacterized protein (TIGR00730 family)